MDALSGAVATAGAAGATLIPRHQLARPRRRCCRRLPVAPTRAPLARCRWLRPRHLVRARFVGCASWETVLPSPDSVLPL